MPPKRLDTDLMTRLEALRVWTQSNLAELRGRNGVGIHAKLRQLNSDVEYLHYRFMYRYKERIAATPFLRTKLEAIDLMLQATVAENVTAAAPSPASMSKRAAPSQDPPDPDPPDRDPPDLPRLTSTEALSQTANNWRAAIKIGGTYSEGPTRAAREGAVEDLRTLNLARPRGLNVVAACAGALQANASAHRQARSASSTTQSGRTEEPSSQSTAVHASPPVGLDTRVCTGAQPSIAAPKIDEEFATAYYTPKKRQEQLQAETFRPRPYRPSRPPSKNPSPLSP